jgi:hypothetical protein
MLTDAIMSIFRIAASNILFPDLHKPSADMTAMTTNNY